MALLLLPNDVILHMAQYFKIEYVEDDDENEYYNSNLLKENGEGYYPLRNLYASCKYFNWLSKLEYIVIECGEFHYHITSRNINGVYHGMTYNLSGNNNIGGYSNYNHNQMVNENCFYTGPYYSYRDIDGISYYEDDQCMRWSDNCHNECKNCIQLDKIQQEIFEKDPFIKELFNHVYDNHKVFIRERIDREFHFDAYCTDNLKLC